MPTDPTMKRPTLYALAALVLSLTPLINAYCLGDDLTPTSFQWAITEDHAGPSASNPPQALVVDEFGLPTKAANPYQLAYFRGKPKAPQSNGDGPRQPITTIPTVRPSIGPPACSNCPGGVCPLPNQQQPGTAPYASTTPSQAPNCLCGPGCQCAVPLANGQPTTYYYYSSSPSYAGSYDGPFRRILGWRPFQNIRASRNAYSAGYGFSGCASCR